MACRSSTERTWALAALLMLAPATVRAQPDDAESELRRGVALRKEGKDAEALEAFQHANTLSPSPRALAQVALAEQALSLWLQAERDLTEALAHEDDPWIRANREALVGVQRLVASRLAWLSIVSNVPNVQITWNGTRASLDAENKVRVIAGEVVVEARAAGYQPYSHTLRIAPETTATLNVQLAREPGTAGAAPLLPPKEQPPPPAQRPTRAYVGWGVAALGAVAAGVGAGFGVVAMRKKSERDEQCVGGCNGAGVDADRAGRRAGLLSTVLIAAGAAGVGTGLVLVLTAPSAKRTALELRGPSLVLSGSF